MELTAAILTLNDNWFALKDDDMVPENTIREMLEEKGFKVIYAEVISKDVEEIKEEIIKCTDELKADLVLTTGATGLAKRDRAPEATAEVIEKRTPGIVQLMYFESFKKTKKAMISRLEAGVRGKSLIINLPGREKGIRENLGAVIDELDHAILMMK